MAAAAAHLTTLLLFHSIGRLEEAKPLGAVLILMPEVRSWMANVSALLGPEEVSLDERNRCGHDMWRGVGQVLDREKSHERSCAAEWSCGLLRGITSNLSELLRVRVGVAMSYLLLLDTEREHWRA